MSASPQPQRPAVSTKAGWPLCALVIGTIVFVTLHFGDIASFTRTLRDAQPLWLVVAAGLQIITYVCVSLGWKLVLDTAGTSLSLNDLVRVALSKLFADAMIPAAGMGGNVVLIDRLVRRGVPGGTAVAALLVSMIGYYAAFAVLALVMLSLLWLGGKATPLLAGVVTIFLMVAAAIPALALWLRRRGSHPHSPMLARIPIVGRLLHVVGEAPSALLSNSKLLTAVAACNGVVFLIDAATLQACLYALGHPTTFTTSFVATLGASIVVALAPLPMGLGSFEAGSTAMLGLLGVPLPAALAGTRLLRGFTLWLPLLPGLLLMRGTAGAERRRPVPMPPAV